jgi:hypothetical protein
MSTAAAAAVIDFAGPDRLVLSTGLISAEAAQAIAVTTNATGEKVALGIDST